VANPTLSPAAQALYNNQGETMRRMVSMQAATLSPDKFTNFNAITSRYPNMSKDLVMSMVQQGLTVDTPGIGKIVSVDGIAQLKNDAMNVENIKKNVKADRGILGSIGSAFSNIVYDPLKGATRVGFAMLRSPYDLATTLTRDLSTGNYQQFAKTLGAGLTGETTQFGALVRDFVGGKPGVQTGSGFFIAPESRVGKDQAKAMAAYGKINGQSFTIGRFAAKSVGANPDTTAYKIMSGMLDATLNIALDPTSWIPVGAATKVIRGGGKLSEYKGVVAPLTAAAQKGLADEKIAAVAQDIDDLKGLSKKELAKGYKRLTSDYQKTALEISTLEKQKVDVLSKSVNKMLNTEKDIFDNLATDPTAAATLAPNKVAEWFIYNPKVQNGQLTTAIDTLSADMKNTGGFFDGFIITDEVPEAGKITVGASGLDEYVMTVKGNEEFNLLNLADDFIGASQDEILEEATRRAKLIDKLELFATETGDVAAMQAFDDLSRALKQDTANFEGFLGSLYTSADELVAGETLGSLIGRVAQVKNPVAMSKIADAVQEIWKVDGFSNIRSIYGGEGGFVITNTPRLAASRAEVAMAAAEIADPTNLGPNLAKLLASIKGTDEAIATRQQQLDDIVNQQLQLDDRISYISSLRELANNDPDILRELINDPEYKGLGKFIKIESEISEKTALREQISAEIGLVDAFGGQLGKDFEKPLRWMLGRRFNQIAEIVAKETDALTIHRFFGKKLDSDIVTALAAATTSDDVLRIFLTHLGAEGTDPRGIKASLSLGLRAEAGKMSVNPLARMVDPVSFVPVRFAESVEKSFNRFYVRGTMVNLGDPTNAVNGIEDWISSAAFKTVLGKARQEEIIAAAQRNLFKATTPQERAVAIESAITQITEEIGKKLDLKPEEIDVLKRATKITGSEEAIEKAYSLGSIAENRVPTILEAGGNTVLLPDALLEHQLLRDMINLPDSKAVLKALTNFQANAIYGKARQGKVLAEELGDVWRTAQLVFRFSYIFRNIAEMQMRQLFSGHNSLISSPLAFLSMVIANPEGNAFQKLVSRWGKYQYDAMGNSFKATDAEEELSDAVRAYRANTNRQQSVSDMRSSKHSQVFKFYKVVDSNHPEFMKGFAYTINNFVADKFIPDVVKLMQNGDEAAKRAYVQRLIDNYDAPDNILKDFSVGVFKKNEGIRNLFLKDPNGEFVPENFNPDNIFIYLFDEKQVDTVAGNIKALAGSGPKSHLVLELLRNGEVVVEKGGKLTKIRAPYAQGIRNTAEMEIAEKKFLKDIEANFTADDVAGSNVFVTTERAIGQPGPKEITYAVDKFFELATRLESKYNFGPEYQMSYWDFMGGYVPMVKTDDLRTLLKNANNSLAPVVFGTKTIGRKHPTLRLLKKELKKRENPNFVQQGGTDLHIVHQMAAREASKYVKDLFYDAARQNQWANAWRLAFPFAQAHYNTLNKWNELFWANPVPAIKFGKAYNALNQQGSNVLYDVSGMTYDDQQGFFYTEPGSTNKQFKIPLVGSVMGAMAGKNIELRDAMQVTAPVQSLNLAFGQVNPGLPGIGPALQGLYAASGKTTAFGPVNDVLRDIITPFGAPKSIEDFVFPAWLRKAVAYRMGDETMVQRGIKDWASYLASTGDYGVNPLASDAARTKLFHDAESLSREVGFMNALFQSISPATPSVEVLAKIKNPTNKMNFMTMTMLYSHWDEISRKNPGDYGKSVYQFAETFGANNLLVALGGSTGNVRGTEDAWTWLNNNPDAADKYARSPGDVIPYFFPGGEYSLKYYNWQRNSGARRSLSATELANEAEGMVYSMLKDQIAEQQIANRYPDFWYKEQIDNLNKQFGGSRPPDTVTTGTAQERIARIGEALQDPAFTQSSVYNQIATFYPKYQEFQTLLNKAKVSNYAELTAKGGLATLMRNELVSLAEELMLENPSFSRMYYGVFAGQLKG
jgi:hypothetical protein